MLQFFETFNMQITNNSYLISKFALLTKNEMSNKESAMFFYTDHSQLREGGLKIH